MADTTLAVPRVPPYSVRYRRAYVVGCDWPAEARAEHVDASPSALARELGSAVAAIVPISTITSATTTAVSRLCRAMIDLRLGPSGPIDRQDVTTRVLRVSRRRTQPQPVIPPSSGITAPVRYEPAREARNTVRPAASSGRPIRPSGTIRATSARFSGVSSMNAIILLWNGPGAIALTVICSDARRRARWRVSMCTAALLAL